MCILVSTFSDQLVEAPEMFSLALLTSDPAVDTGLDALVTIADSNTGAVLVSLDQIVYNGAEGGSVDACVLVQASSVTAITRRLSLRITTMSGSAQGVSVHSYTIES